MVVPKTETRFFIKTKPIYAPWLANNLIELAKIFTARSIEVIKSRLFSKDIGNDDSNDVGRTDPPSVGP